MCGYTTSAGQAFYPGIPFPGGQTWVPDSLAVSLAPLLRGCETGGAFLRLSAEKLEHDIKLPRVSRGCPFPGGTDVGLTDGVTVSAAPSERDLDRHVPTTSMPVCT